MSNVTCNPFVYFWLNKVIQILIVALIIVLVYERLDTMKNIIKFDLVAAFS